MEPGNVIKPTTLQRLTNFGYKATITVLFGFVLFGGFNLASGTYHILTMRKKLEAKKAEEDAKITEAINQAVSSK